MKPKAIAVQIDELVLEGFPPADHLRIADAVKHEMQRLLSSQPLPQQISTAAQVQQLDGGAFEVAEGQTPENVGARVAQSIFGAWKA